MFSFQRINKIVSGRWFFNSTNLVIYPYCKSFAENHGGSQWVTDFYKWENHNLFCLTSSLLEISMDTKFKQEKSCESLGGFWGWVDWETTRPFWADLNFQEYEELLPRQACSSHHQIVFGFILMVMVSICQTHTWY